MKYQLDIFGASGTALVETTMDTNGDGIVAGTVWEDVNQDRTLDGFETLLIGVTVTLYDSGNNVVGSAVTQADGSYLITDIPVGADYYLIFTKPAAYGNFSPQDQAGGDGTLDRDANSSGQTSSINIVMGTVETYISAGVFGAPLPISYSPIIAIQSDCHAEEQIWRLYPNPVGVYQNEITLEFYQEQEMESILIVNALGSLVQKVELASNYGRTIKTIELNSLAAGTYYLMIMGQRDTKTLKFIRLAD